MFSVRDLCASFGYNYIQQNALSFLQTTLDSMWFDCLINAKMTSVSCVEDEGISFHYTLAHNKQLVIQVILVQMIHTTPHHTTPHHTTPHHTTPHHTTPHHTTPHHTTPHDTSCRQGSSVAPPISDWSIYAAELRRGHKLVFPVNMRWSEHSR